MKYGALVPMVRHEIRRLGGVIDRERYGRHLVIYWSIGEAKRDHRGAPLDLELAHAEQCARPGSPERQGGPCMTQSTYPDAPGWIDETTSRTPRTQLPTMRIRCARRPLSFSRTRR